MSAPDFHGLKLLRPARPGSLTAATIAALLIMPLVVGLCGCGKSTPPPRPPSRQSGTQPVTTGKPEVGQLPERLDRLTFKLFNQVWDGSAGKKAAQVPQNVFISPASLEFALAMTMNGADGGTLQVMKKALELEGLSTDEINRSNKGLIDWLSKVDPKVTLEIANSLWGKKGVSFADAFLQANRDYYGAQIESLDFNTSAAAQKINDWVNQKTKGKIKDIIKPPIDPQAILFLLNAIYFKGTWTVPFDKAATRQQDFTSSDGSVKKVPMMAQSGKYSYMENAEFQAVRLPYGDGKLGMYVFLPKEKQGLVEFLGELNAESWKKWLSRFGESPGDLQMPRFKVEYEKVLNDALSALGMEVAFSRQANFTKMVTGETAKQEVFIRQVKQKTYVDVNEEGTEAAAVTSVEMGATAAPPGDQFKMTVDHPFFFAIRDDSSGAILFTGGIVSP